MALISEETCANCAWHRYDDEKTIWCCNPQSPDHLEDVTWDHSCDYYEVYEDDSAMPNMYKHHYPVPFLLQEDDPECPYVRCALDNKVKPKWSGGDCEDWEEDDG